MNKPTILVVEDDKAVRHLITTTLELQGYNFRDAETGATAMIEATRNPDVIILDLGLPDMDGVEIVQKVRAWSNVPIIIVSSRGEEKDKIDALDCGADDYLTKPFSVEELLARLRVMLRRTSSLHANENAVFTNGELKIDYAAGRVFLNDEEIHLTPIEYKLLCLLSKNVDKVLTHNFILKEIWVRATAEDIPSLRVYMAMLRKKIEGNASEPKYIQTHISVGYRMVRV